MKIWKFKQYFIGALIGGVLASTGTVFAKTEISAVVADWVNFKFNDQLQELPQGYTTLIYQGRTYVPARYVAEQLGATVGWDESTQTVSIVKPEAPKEAENPSINYQQIPVTQTRDGVTTEVYAVTTRDSHTYFYLRVKNTTENPMQVLQAVTTFESEGVVYQQSKVKDYNQHDKAWYSDIYEDEDREGYVLVPEVEDNNKSGILSVTVLQNDGSKKEIPFKFNVSWK